MDKIEKSDYIFKRSSNGYENFLQKVICLGELTKEIFSHNVVLREGVHFMNCLHRHYTNEEIMRLVESIETDDIK